MIAAGLRVDISLFAALAAVFGWPLLLGRRRTWLSADYIEFFAGRGGMGRANFANCGASRASDIDLPIKRFSTVFCVDTRFCRA